MGMKNLKETMAAVRRRGIRIKICPVCGSADVSAITMTGYITQPAYTCNKCGFQNTIFPEVDPTGEDGAASAEAALSEDDDAKPEEGKDEPE